jgi:hypothetical protein
MKIMLLAYEPPEGSNQPEQIKFVEDSLCRSFTVVKVLKVFDPGRLANEMEFTKLQLELPVGRMVKL